MRVEGGRGECPRVRLGRLHTRGLVPAYAGYVIDAAFEDEEDSVWAGGWGQIDSAGVDTAVKQAAKVAKTGKQALLTRG